MSEPVARNLLTDPKPTRIGKWRQGGGSNLTVRMLDGDKLHITNNIDRNDSYIYLWLTDIPAGTYRFGVEVSNPQNGYASNMLRMLKQNPTTELAPARWDGVAGRLVTPANEITTDGPVELRIMVGPKQNSAIWVRQLFFMTEEDYQQMIAQGVTWFDGDGIVRGGGGFLLAFPIHMWIAALLWWWSHEQAHHPPRRATGHRLQKLCAHTETGSADRSACGGRSGIGRGRTPGWGVSLPVHKGRDHEHGHTIAPVGVCGGHGGRGYHARPIQAGVPSGHGKDRHLWLHGHIQHGRRLVQIVAFRGHAARRDGRIPCDPAIQPVLPVTSSLVVAA